jgi:hypothetical protein
MYVNGTAGIEEITAPPVATAPNPSSTVAPCSFTAERVAEIRTRLLEPFDPAEIKWRVTATSTQQSKHGPVKRGQLVAYADPRAYTDRLNDIFGEWGWTRTYAVQVAQNFERTIGRGPNGQKQTAICAKVVVVSTVTVNGLGSHTGVGEEWADDENSATRAEAQAFKRACACFGLGRYLYDLDKIWEDLDQYNRPVRTPALPDWALPPGARAQVRPQPARPVAQPRQGLVQQETLARVQDLCGKVGFGLSRFVLRTYGGTTEPEKIGFAKLTMVMERLTDIANGVARLRKAADGIGGERYAAICRELNLASDSIDDIPDRNTLRLLLTKAETESGRSNSGSAPPSVTIAEARGRLLQAARKVAESGGKNGWPERLGEVIARASGGTITLDSLRGMTGENVAQLTEVTKRLES